MPAGHMAAYLNVSKSLHVGSNFELAGQRRASYRRRVVYEHDTSHGFRGRDFRTNDYSATPTCPLTRTVPFQAWTRKC
jgi:hypothetical protein